MAVKKRPVEPSTVLEAVDRDLDRLRAVDPVLASGGLALAARALARALDDPGNSATSKSMCAKTLLDMLDRLRELTPKAAERDALDDLATRRAARLAGGAAAKG